MQINVQCNTFNTCICRSQSFNCTPFISKICFLCIIKSSCYLVKPQIDICFINILINKLTFINKRNNRFIINAIFNSILMDKFAELRHSILLILHKRSTGEANITRIRKYGSHLSCKRAIVGTMAFIYKHKYIS